MSDDTKLEKLRSIDFFRDISEEHLQQLAALAKEATFPAQHNIFEEHEAAKDVYLIVSGKVSLVTCTPKVGCRQMMAANSGDLIGWSPLLGRPRLSDTARTITPTEALVFDATALLEMCEANNEFGYKFMTRTAHVLAERLGATRVQLLDTGGIHLPHVAMETD